MFDGILKDNHEQLSFFSDKETGLKAIIGIHSTVLGPSMGGTRMWPYDNEEDAIRDVLRLSRGMTFKSAISGLNIGGGKAVIIGDPKIIKTPELLYKFGECVDSLSGKYITAEDVNMSEIDMEEISKTTKYVVGKSELLGGNGDPSPVTAYTTYLGMKAAVNHKYGSDSLTNKKILVEGVGHVGTYLVELLVKEGALVMVTDIFEDKINHAVHKFGVKAAPRENLFGQDFDIYAPCALGGSINDESLSLLKCQIIAGAANNQLEDEDIHAQACIDKGILYAPDFLINSGGIINVCAEYYNETKASAFKKAEYVYQAAKDIFIKSEKEGLSTQAAAMKIAQERIESVASTKKNHL